MLVRDAMNRIVVTVDPGHTLRDAAQRMTESNVGAAVVLDADQPGPGIITERDLLGSGGRGEDVDTELVRDHLSARPTYAEADWPLERAAEVMVRGAFRHVIVVDAGEPIGILSMRDIVRCWTSEGAHCDLPGATAGEMA